MNLGQKLKDFRENLGMSQTGFSRALNISQTAVSQYELNQKTPSPRVINKFVNFAKLHNIELTLDIVS